MTYCRMDACFEKKEIKNKFESSSAWRLFWALVLIFLTILNDNLNPGGLAVQIHTSHDFYASSVHLAPNSDNSDIDHQKKNDVP